MTQQFRMTQDNHPVNGLFTGVATPHGDKGPRLFIVHCHGEVDYPEAERIYGVWQAPHTILLGDGEHIEDAMALAASAMIADHFGLDDVPDALAFWPRTVTICDRADQLVLAGEVVGSGVSWSAPVNSDGEAEQVGRRVEELLNEATYEAGWDNFSTAKRLRERARILAGRLVHPAWRGPASRALQFATSS